MQKETEYHNPNIQPREWTLENLFEPKCPQKKALLYKRLEADPESYGAIILNHEVRGNGIDIDPSLLVTMMGKVASQADAYSPNPLFFTSSPWANRQKAEEIASKSMEHDVIHTTPVGWYLERLELFNDGISAIDGDIAYLPWYVAAIRYALNAQPNSENVMIFMEEGDPSSTLYTAEMYAILANQSIKTINREDKWRYVGTLCPDLIDFASSVLSTRSVDEHEQQVKGLSLSRKFNKYSDRTSSDLILAEKQAYRYELISEYLYPLLIQMHQSLSMEKRAEASLPLEHLESIASMEKPIETKQYRKVIMP